MKKYAFPLLILLLLVSCAEKAPLYKDAGAAPEARARDLIGRMTLQEKVQQLRSAWNGFMAMYSPEGELDWDQFGAAYGDGLGGMERMSEDKSSFMALMASYSPGRSTRAVVEQYNRFQHYFVDSTRLGIPLLVHEEGLHGLIAGGTTHFPMPIGLACSWDEDLMTDIYTIVAKEIRARGGHQVLAPVTDIVRDPRWGRTEETMGEDPYLCGRLGAAQIKAYQGEEGPHGEIDAEHVAATIKHFGVHGQSEGGSNTGPHFVDRLYAYETFFRPVRMAIDEAHPHSVMISYPETWGVPAHINRELIQDGLRGALGFDGLIVSDYGGIEDAVASHIVSDKKEAAYLAFQAGVEWDLPEGASYQYLPELVKEGRIKEADIDKAVYHVLLEKFRLGLFENPYLDPDASEAALCTPEASQIAYKAAAESMVLLQNRGDVLPFDASKIRTLAVIGPNATATTMGGYSGAPKYAVSVLDAVKAKYGDRMNILYAEGSKITYQPQKGGDIIASAVVEDYLDHSVEAPESINRPLVDEAVALARRADAVILCLGSNSSVAREGTGPTLPGDTPSLELLGMQNELAERIAALGKPTCALVITGTANNTSRLAEAVPAVVQCWYGGQEGGNAWVDAVFGEINPSGKLTISIPRGGDHVPAYYAYKRSSRRGYTLGQDISPLWPFGHGLSYTTYKYENVRLSASEMTADGCVEALVDVTNTGTRAGDEIVQMYICDEISSVSRPVKELRGFARVHLEPGETKTVRLPIDRSSLEFYNADLKLVAEPGEFTVMVGPSSAETQSALLTLR